MIICMLFLSKSHLSSTFSKKRGSLGQSMRRTCRILDSRGSTIRLRQRTMSITSENTILWYVPASSELTQGHLQFGCHESRTVVKHQKFHSFLQRPCRQNSPPMVSTSEELADFSLGRFSLPTC